MRKGGKDDEGGGKGRVARVLGQEGQVRIARIIRGLD